MAYTIREQSLNYSVEETALDYSLIKTTDYRTLKYDELGRHVEVLEMYAKNLIEYILVGDYPLSKKPALHAESHAITRQLALAKNLYINFTVAQQQP